MVPIPRRASSFLVGVFIHVYRKEEEVGKTEQQQTYQFTKGCNILHRLHVHHLTLTFIIHNQYIMSTLYLYTYIPYIYIMNCSIHNAFCRGRGYIFSPTRDFCLIKLLPPELLEHSIPAYTTYPLSHSEDIVLIKRRYKAEAAMHDPGNIYE